MLARKASQVLLSFLLVRDGGGHTQTEFAARAGVGGDYLPTALVQFERTGLIQSIPQGVNEEIIDELTSTYGSFDAFLPTLPILPDQVQTHDPGGVIPGDGGAGAYTPGADQNGKLKPSVMLRGASEPDQDGVGGPLVLCRKADESGRRTDQIKALQAAWAEAFPLPEYEYQQLQVQAAKHFLVGRSAEEVGEVILDAPKRTKSKIESPRAYIESVLAGKKSRDEDEPIITDGLRELARQAKEQIRGKHRGASQAN